jgi:hypothetical protein
MKALGKKGPQGGRSALQALLKNRPFEIRDLRFKCARKSPFFAASPRSWVSCESQHTGIPGTLTAKKRPTPRPLSAKETAGQPITLR